jgi:hypothetical protein
MSEMSAIDGASKRLALALDALEAAVERRRLADRDQQGLTAQLHALGSDRAQLACELDAAAARSKQLETTNREIVRRIDAAMDRIRSVLESNEEYRRVSGLICVALALSSPRRRGPMNSALAMLHDQQQVDASGVMGPRLRGSDSDFSSRAPRATHSQAAVPCHR